MQSRNTLHYLAYNFSDGIRDQLNSVHAVNFKVFQFLKKKSEMFPWRLARHSQMTNFLPVYLLWFLWFPDGRKNEVTDL